jgi:hypothetical protein
MGDETTVREIYKRWFELVRPVTAGQRTMQPTLANARRLLGIGPNDAIRPAARKAQIASHPDRVGESTLDGCRSATYCVMAKTVHEIARGCLDVDKFEKDKALYVAE